MPLEVNQRRVPLSDPSKCGGTLRNSATAKLGEGRPVILSDGDALAALTDPQFRQHVERADAADRLVLKRALPQYGAGCDYWFGIVPDFNGAWGAPVAMTVEALNRGGIIGQETMDNLYRTERSEAEREADATRTRAELAESARVQAEYDAARPTLWDDLGESAADVANAIKDFFRDALDPAADAAKKSIIAIAAIGLAALYFSRK